MTAIGWVKAHKGIEGNEHADQGTKRASEVRDKRERVTEGGIKQAVSEERKAERKQDGWGKGKVVGWSRQACTHSIHIYDMGRIPEEYGQRRSVELGTTSAGVQSPRNRGTCGVQVRKA